jgi:hypothetical protein
VTLGTKLVFALAVEMRAAYQRLAIDPVVGDCGVLLRDNPLVPST